MVTRVRIEKEWTSSQLRHAGILAPVTVKQLLPYFQRPSDFIKAFALRDRVMTDLASGSGAELASTLKSVARLSVSRDILAKTGLGYLIKDDSIWIRAGNESRKLAYAIRYKWSTQLKGAPLEIPELSLIPSLKGFKSSVFQSDVIEMKAWLSSVDSASPDEQLVNQSAVLLVLHGFRCPKHMRGLAPGTSIPSLIAPPSSHSCAELWLRLTLPPAFSGPL